MAGFLPHPHSIKLYARVAANAPNCGQSVKVVGGVEVRPQGTLCLIVLATIEEKRVVSKDSFESRVEDGRLSLAGGDGQRRRLIKGNRI